MQIAALLAATLASAHAPQPDFAKTWATVDSMIRSRYWARQSKKEFMERQLAETKPKAEKAASKEDFSRIVNAMIDRFGDSHFDFFTPEDQGYYVMDQLARMGQAGQKAPHLDAWFKPGKDGYTVQMVLNGGALERADVRKGDVVVSIDGAPFSPIESMRSKVGATARLTLRRGSERFEKSVQVQESTLMDMFVTGSRRSTRIIDDGGKKVGYFHLWTMASDDFRNALSNAVFGPLRDTEAMILDVRDGFGGRPEGFGDPFFRPGVKLKWTFGEGAGSEQLFGYDRPLVVLINEGSRSAKEVFAYIMKKSKRAVLIGTHTAGHVLGTSPARVEDWAYLEIPMVQLEADGEKLEGIGVQPDIVVSPEFDGSGKDLHLERALKYLRERA